MNRSDDNDATLSLDSQIDEDRVRRALGLKTSSAPHQQRPEQARQRHRFVTDGAVPVVMLNRSDSETVGLRERLASVESALEHERTAHASTKRTLQELNAVHHALQTRLQHNEMARADSFNVEKQARIAAQEELAALRREMAEMPRRVRRVEPHAVIESPHAATPAETDGNVTPGATTNAAAPGVPLDPIAVALKRGRKPRAGTAVKEDKPIRWWTPSYRAKKTR